jgi:hypothetical protein
MLDFWQDQAATGLVPALLRAISSRRRIHSGLSPGPA